MVIQIQHRRATAAAWTAANPTLAEGEWGYETDSKKYKIGDGTTLWIPLPYVGVQGVISDYIKLDPMGCMIPTTNSASVARAETSTNKVNYVYGNFTEAGDGVNRLQWKEILKEDWKSDGTVTVKFHSLSEAGTPTNKFKWQIWARQFADDDPLDTALVSLGVAEDAITAAGDVLISVSTSATAITGTAGSIVIFEIQRIASAATETTADMRLLGASVLYTRVIT